MELVVSDAKTLNFLNKCKKVDLFFRKIIFEENLFTQFDIIFIDWEGNFLLERIWQENKNVEDLLSLILTGEFQFKAGSWIHLTDDSARAAILIIDWNVADSGHYLQYNTPSSG